MKPKTVVITGCTRGLGRAILPLFIYSMGRGGEKSGGVLDRINKI